MHGRLTRAPCGRVFRLLAVAAVVLASSAGAPALAAPAEVTLTVTVTGMGQVMIEPTSSICSSTCFLQFAVGTSVALTPTAGSGYSFTGWSQACAGAGDTCTLEVDADATVGAVFATAAETTTTGTTTAIAGAGAPPPPSRPPTHPVTKPKPKPRPLSRPAVTRPTFTVPRTVSPSPTTTANPRAHQFRPPAHYHLVAPPSGGAGGEPASSFDTELDHALATLDTGAVAFNVPGSMRLNARAEIQLLLSLTQKATKLQAQISADGQKEGSPVRISRDVSAQLTGIGFNIIAETPTRQAVSRTENTEWRWQIQATNTGLHHLHLTLSAFVHLQSGDRERMVKTFDRKLEINVTLMQRVSSFVDGNWKWLWTTILIPLGAATIRRLRQRSASETPPPAPHGHG
jgi:hypothetical protein